MKKLCLMIALLLTLALCLASCNGAAVGISGAKLNEKGELVLTLTDGTEQNVGKVTGEKGDPGAAGAQGPQGEPGEDGESATDENPQGLDFYLLPDGTYGVKAGKAMYLEEIVIPESYNSKPVTQVLDMAFVSGIGGVGGASYLKKISIPNIITTIGFGVFANCTSLQGITIPASVTSIGFQTFAGCSSLTSIEIPVGVTEIGNEAFFDCSSLATVYYGGSASDWTGISIDHGNDALKNATRYYYAENKPEADHGSYWHYVDGVPTVWKEND